MSSILAIAESSWPNQHTASISRMHLVESKSPNWNSMKVGWTKTTSWLPNWPALSREWGNQAIYTSLWWGFIPSFPTQGQLEKCIHYLIQEMSAWIRWSMRKYILFPTLHSHVCDELILVFHQSPNTGNTILSGHAFPVLLNQKFPLSFQGMTSLKLFQLISQFHREFSLPKWPFLLLPAKKTSTFLKVFANHPSEYEENM